MSLILTLRVLVFAACLRVSGGMTPFCQPRSGGNYSSNYYGPKLPTLPNAFVATVEATIVNRNATFLMTEYYDQSANKGAVRREGNGSSVYMIYNYDENEVMAIDEKSGACNVQDIDTMHGFPFFGRNSSKIEGIADLFRFGAEFNETYLGTAVVRGIRCHQWQACINMRNHSFLLDYYFSATDWTMPHGSGNMRVVRATINGTTTSHHHSHTSLPGNTTRSFYHVYDFFSFKPGHPPMSTFQIPPGTFCVGMKDRKSPPAMKAVFTVETETVLPIQKTVKYTKELYDSDRNLSMVWYYDMKHKRYGPTRLGFDFNYGVLYNITGSVCHVEVLTLNNSMEIAYETADHHWHMKTYSQMLFSHNKSALIYTGSASVRGFDADVFVMKREIQKYEITTLYYFSKKNWIMRGGLQSPVLLKLEYYVDSGKILGSTVNVMNFDAESIPLSMFNLHPCYVDNNNRISIRLVGDWSKIVFKRETEFNIGVRSSVARVANVSKIRVDNVENSHSPEFIEVWFTILGKPPVHTTSSVPENGLEKAVDAVRNQVVKGQFVIEWEDPVKGKMTHKADTYFHNAGKDPIPKPTTKPTRPPKRGKTTGTPGGAVAGIAILMVAIGICIGLAIAHFVMRRQGHALFRYQRQE